MDRLRRPFLLAAVVASIVVLLVELGSLAQPLMQLLGIREPPGIGIPALALLDVQLAFAAVLYGLGTVLPHAVIGRLQGIASLIVAIVLIIAAIVAIFLAITLLLLMISLIASFFGVVVYLALYGSFPRSQAALILSVLLTGKVIFGVLLLLAHQRFLQNKGLVLLVVTSLVANVVIGLLHGLVPLPLVSVTDALAAIIVAILALLWAIGLLIGAVIAIVRILKPEKRELAPPANRPLEKIAA